METSPTAASRAGRLRGRSERKNNSSGISPLRGGVQVAGAGGGHGSGPRTPGFADRQVRGPLRIAPPPDGAAASSPSLRAPRTAGGPQPRPNPAAGTGGRPGRGSAAAPSSPLRSGGNFVGFRLPGRVDPPSYRKPLPAAASRTALPVGVRGNAPRTPQRSLSLPLFF